MVTLEVADVFFVLTTNDTNDTNYWCHLCYLLFLNYGAAAEVKLRRERYAVHFLFGFVLEGDFLFGDDGAGEKLAFDVYPCMFRHQELMQIPCEPCFVEGVGLEIPFFLIVLLAHCLTRE